MPVKEEFEILLERLKIERDKLNLKMHLASMEVKEEFGEAEKKWVHVKQKAAEFADDTKDVSEELVDKAKIVGEELKEAYSRINKRLSK
jgi:hypothetical protein